MSWRLISEPPPVDVEVLCWPRDSEHATVEWTGERWRLMCCGQTHYEITHWMPLPKGPEK